MDKNDHTARVTHEEDYVRCPKFGNSLSRFLDKNPEGVDDAVIARLLLIPEADVSRLYEEAVLLLREDMID